MLYLRFSLFLRWKCGSVYYHLSLKEKVIAKILSILVQFPVSLYFLIYSNPIFVIFKGSGPPCPPLDPRMYAQNKSLLLGVFRGT